MVKVQFLFALGMAENWLPIRKVRRMQVQIRGRGQSPDSFLCVIVTE